MTGLMEAALTRVICKQARLKQHLSCPIQLMYLLQQPFNRIDYVEDSGIARGGLSV